MRFKEGFTDPQDPPNAVTNYETNAYKSTNKTFDL